MDYLLSREMYYPRHSRVEGRSCLSIWTSKLQIDPNKVNLLKGDDQDAA